MLREDQRAPHRPVVSCGPAVSSASHLKMAVRATPWKQAVVRIEWMASNDHRCLTFESISRARESREGIDDENVANPCPGLQIFAVEHSATGCARRLHDQRIPE